MVEVGHAGAVSGAKGEMVDLAFILYGRAIALDYADRLWSALSARLPWLVEESAAGVHPLAGVSPGDTELYLTRRARLSLRLPQPRIHAARSLTGLKLDLDGEIEVVGEGTERRLAPASVLYSSFVTVGETDEELFLAACRRQLAESGIAGQLVCGRPRRGVGAGGEWRGFSLMLHALSKEHSMQLQRVGLGGERKRGCGIFVPHKSIAAVGE